MSASDNIIIRYRSYERDYLASALNAYDAVVIDSESPARQAVHALPVVVWIASMLAFALRSVRKLSH
jgi:hypothetical protein